MASKAEGCEFTFIVVVWARAEGLTTGESIGQISWQQEFLVFHFMRLSNEYSITEKQEKKDKPESAVVVDFQWKGPTAHIKKLVQCDRQSLNIRTSRRKNMGISLLRIRSSGQRLLPSGKVALCACFEFGSGEYGHSASHTAEIGCLRSSSGTSWKGICILHFELRSD